MIYTIERATLISEQLKKFTTGFTYHLAGHVANLDFWLSEVITAIKTIEEHRQRFEKLKEAQIAFVEKHEIVFDDYCPMCGGKCEFDDSPPKPPMPPNRRYRAELNNALKDLKDSAYYFLVRCYNAAFLALPELEEKCKVIGTSIEPSDLRKSEEE